MRKSTVTETGPGRTRQKRRRDPLFSFHSTKETLLPGKKFHFSLDFLMKKGYYEFGPLRAAGAARRTDA